VDLSTVNAARESLSTTLKNDDLEKELRQNLKLRRELQGEIAKAEASGHIMRSRWLRVRDWFVTRWVDFQGWQEDRRRRR
jgi:hypothetical protein